ncbi:uncharacterized protein LOC18101520 [Populus trichocarpa]|uniref:uncharacterized protein LOC18101520 n=1 Tax=Populus trichocarpa TaxID=3694 RepID=UPI0022182B0E|nr:uncharacterized protein LOC18101520 [Populus trichocarpa]XP_052311430.1 uncharacterized protein LOC18101520 [Populus trichocarpa]KAI5579880.1 hypothetical protein BDE02_08G118500 [Populus trichocarpa]KAI5579882.1 hypothetical protein BDE02_08G118500 [Populus trichocarpa]KAI5579883.1 hypothetical protein BDE02_08G118500 [Populus trichocarpa]
MYGEPQIERTYYLFLDTRFGGVQTCDPPSWKWEMVWHWMTAFPWIPSLCTGIFSTGLCLWREHKATETAIIYGLESVWGSGFTWFLLGERMGAAPVLGGSLRVHIFGSSSLLYLENTKREVRKVIIFSVVSAYIWAGSRKDVPNTVKTQQ